MVRKAKIKILDEVNCAIIGLSPDHVTYFYEEYARKAPNFFFNPKYKLGQWDGRIRYFHKNGKTYVYLLNDIVPQLVGLGYKVVVEDDRTSNVPTPAPVDENIFSHIFHPEWNEYIKLRNYQVDSINALLNNGGGLCIAGTGAGKTITGAALAHSYGEQGIRSITIVPSQDLIEQTAETYEICQLDTGRYYSEVKTIDRDHVVSTWQSLQNNPKLLNEFGMVIVDECLDANTLITLSNGTKKPIKNIQAGDLVLTLNEATHSLEVGEVIKKHKNISPNEKMFRLEFDNGIIMNVTGNHKILTTEGWIRADKLNFEHNIINTHGKT